MALMRPSGSVPKRKGIVIGIDPGIGGAIAAVTFDGTLVRAARTPVIIPASGKGRKLMDLQECVRFLREVLPGTDSCIACMEKVHAMPRDGVAGSFSFGASYGSWKGMLAALDVPLVEVTPQQWQKQMLAGQSGEDTKSKAVAAAKSLYPKIPIRVKADWGLADAVLIADYARRSA